VPAAARTTLNAKLMFHPGLIVPDLPYAETSAFRDEAIKNDLELVTANPLVQPIITVFY
jgi:tryptophan synthase alpha subunit